MKVSDACEFYRITSIITNLEKHICRLTELTQNESLIQSLDNIRYSMSVLPNHPGNVDDDNPRDIIKHLFQSIVVIDSIRVKEKEIFNQEVLDILFDISIESSSLDSMFMGVFE